MNDLPILKWPISARPLSQNELVTARHIRGRHRGCGIWESSNCAVAKARYMLEAWEVAEHLGVDTQYVYDNFLYDEWHHRESIPWERENMGKVYFYDPGNILNDLAKNEEMRLTIRKLAEIKHPDILADSSVYTGWEKRLYSRDGHRRHGVVGKFVPWRDLEHIEEQNRKIRERVEARIIARRGMKANQQYLV